MYDKGAATLRPSQAWGLISRRSSSNTCAVLCPYPLHSMAPGPLGVWDGFAALLRRLHTLRKIRCVVGTLTDVVATGVHEPTNPETCE